MSTIYIIDAYNKQQFRRIPRRVRIGKRIGLGLATLVLLAAPSARGQEKFVLKGHATPSANRAPLPHLYMNFLLYQNHLDKAAAQHEAQGKDGSWLRNLLQERLGFTSSQFSVVRASAVRLESELNDIKVRASAAIQADHAASAQSPNAPRAAIRQLPALDDLRKEREDVIQREIDGLNRELGPEASAKLQATIEDIFSQNQAIHVTPAPPRAPKLLPPQAESPAVRP